MLTEEEIKELQTKLKTEEEKRKEAEQKLKDFNVRAYEEKIKEEKLKAETLKFQLDAKLQEEIKKMDETTTKIATLEAQNARLQELVELKEKEKIQEYIKRQEAEKLAYRKVIQDTSEDPRDVLKRSLIGQTLKNKK